MPLGNGATFDPTQYLTASHGVVPWINAEDYSIPVYRASASDPLVTINAVSGTNIGPVTVRIPANAQSAAGTDKHLVVISPDGLSSDEWEGLDLSTRTAYVYIHVDLEGSGVGIGWARATGVSELGGLIRNEEVAGGVIPHALAFGLPGGLISPNCPIWPAITCDGGGEGSLLAIPPDTPKPAGLSPLGSAIFDALQHYGGYDVDQTGGGAAVVYAEPAVDAKRCQRRPFRHGIDLGTRACCDEQQSDQHRRPRHKARALGSRHRGWFSQTNFIADEHRRCRGRNHHTASDHDSAISDNHAVTFHDIAPGRHGEASSADDHTAVEHNVELELFGDRPARRINDSDTHLQGCLTDRLSARICRSVTRRTGQPVRVERRAVTASVAASLVLRCVGSGTQASRNAVLVVSSCAA